jgi:hypothetical protein
MRVEERAATSDPAEAFLIPWRGEQDRSSDLVHR